MPLRAAGGRGRRAEGVGAGVAGGSEALPYFLGGVDAAVDVEGGAGDEAVELAREKDGGARDVVDRVLGGGWITKEIE